MTTQTFPPASVAPSPIDASVNPEATAETAASPFAQQQAPVQQAPFGQPEQPQANYGQPAQQAPFGQPEQTQANYGQPVQQAPVQQTPVQQAPVQQTPVQQAPFGQPVQQAPFGQPVQQEPAQQAPFGQPAQQQAPFGQNVQPAPAATPSVTAIIPPQTSIAQPSLGSSDSITANPGNPMVIHPTDITPVIQTRNGPANNVVTAQWVYINDPSQQVYSGLIFPSVLKSSLAQSMHSGSYVIGAKVVQGEAKNRGSNPPWLFEGLTADETERAAVIARAKNWLV